MRRTWLVLVPTVLLCLVGVVASFNLTIKHQVKSTGLAWFDNTCEGGEESARSCDAVLASKWGYLPPFPEHASEEERGQTVRVLGMFSVRPRPSALVGLFYFSAMAAWYIAIGRPSYPRRIYHLAPLLVNLAGVASAVFFAYIMLTGLEAWCPWCMVTHVVNVLMLIGAILLWPRKPVAVQAEATADAEVAPDKAASPEESSATSPRPTYNWAGRLVMRTAAAAPTGVLTGPSARHPSRRLALVALGAIVAIVIAEDHFNSALTVAKLRRQEVGKLTAELQKVQADAQILYSMYVHAEKQEITLREDDPVLNAGINRLSMVIFTDFQCPHCSKFAKLVTDQLAPLFEGNLMVTFKHFPASPKCNRYVPQEFHPLACYGAVAAETARRLGGNEAFWKAHDLFFASQDKLGKTDFYRGVATEIGLDPDEFIEAMDSEESRNRVLEDIEQGKTVGVDATPAVFVAGHRVPRIAMQQMHFWRMLKKNFDAALKTQLQAQQQADVEGPQASPNNQGPGGAK